MKEKILEIIRKSSIFLLILVTFILLITTSLFFVKITVTPLHLPIIYIVSIVAFLLFYKKDSMKRNTISILVATLVFVIGIFVCGNIYDSTVDGNTYHKLAIGSMKNGWNPVYEASEDFTKAEGNAFDPAEENINTMWINHYGKATEIFGAVVYDFTSNIETAKVFTLLFMYILFGISLSYLTKKSNIYVALVVSLLLVVNPITLVQFNNFYVDAALGLTIILILYCLNNQNNDYKDMDKKETLFILASAIIWSINIKFTGLAYSAIICAVFYFYILCKKYKQGKEPFIKELKGQTIFYVITVIISLGIVGFSTYVTNTINQGNPLYPLYGENAVENIGTKEAPKSFQDKNRIQTFLISIFAKGVNVSSLHSESSIEPELKIPFTFTVDEIRNYNIPDIRMSGFGPLFSGIFIITVIGMVYIIVKLIKNKDYNNLIPFVLLIITTAVIILAFDGNYWAIYIAFMYVLPIIVLFSFLKSTKDKPQFVIGVIFAIIIAMNSGLIMYTQIKNIEFSKNYIDTKLETFKEYCEENENVEIKLQELAFQGVLYNLDDMNLLDKITVNQEIDATRDVYMFNY